MSFKCRQCKCKISRSRYNRAKVCHACARENMVKDSRGWSAWKTATDPIAFEQGREHDRMKG